MLNLSLSDLILFLIDFRLIFRFFFFSLISDILDYNTLVLPTDSTGNSMLPIIIRPKGTYFHLFVKFILYKKKFS